MSMTQDTTWLLTLSEKNESLCLWARALLPRMPDNTSAPFLMVFEMYQVRSVNRQTIKTCSRLTHSLI